MLLILQKKTEKKFKMTKTVSKKIFRRRLSKWLNLKSNANKQNFTNKLQKLLLLNGEQELLNPKKMQKLLQ